MSANQEVITAGEVQAAQTERKSLIRKFADKYGLEPNRMMDTLRATAFKGDVTNEQMAALLIVADQHGLNPWLKEIYAFPSRQGIVPVVGVDGWARIINEHPAFDGMDFAETDASCTCTIHRKDRAHPVTITEYAAECARSTDPWKTHPKRMLRHKAMIQCARLAFSFAGIYDPDEADRVLAAEDAIDVTPTPTVPAEDAPKRIGAVRMRKIVEGMNAAVAKDDGPGLLEIIGELSNDEFQGQVWPLLRSYERSAIKELQRKAEAAGQGIGLDKWSCELIANCQDAKALAASWNAIQSAYDENGAEVPPDVETVYNDRKADLA